LGKQCDWQLTWKGTDERLLAIESVDAACLLVELTDAVLAIEDADELDNSFQKLTAGAPGGTENHNLTAHGKSKTGGENCDAADTQEESETPQKP
tara:strand:+ start:1113 stop:1397 length:285 start_codon:yes stop_codon:yes gene_type:complete